MNYTALVMGIALPLLALASGCDADPVQSEVSVSGVESFCVKSMEGPDGPQLQVDVYIDECSTSCDTVVESECTLTEVAGALQIEASAVIESEGGPCTLDCGTVEASCTLPAVPGETYVVRGDDGVEVEVEADGGGEPTCTPDGL